MEEEEDYEAVDADLGEEELYVVDDDDDADDTLADGNSYFDDDGGLNLEDQNFDEPKVDPLLTNPALRNIGWMCGDPMPDYAHVVFAAVR